MTAMALQLPALHAKLAAAPLAALIVHHHLLLLATGGGGGGDDDGSKGSALPWHLTEGAASNASTSLATSTADGSTPVQGLAAVCRAMSRLATLNGLKHALYGQTAVDASAVDTWLDTAEPLASMTDFKQLQVSWTAMDTHLRLRSFFAGYDATLADYVVFATMKTSNVWLRVVKGKNAPVHLTRWYGHISAMPAVQNALAAIETAAKSAKQPAGGASKKASSSSAANTLSDQGSFAIDLEGAVKGKVVTRFPPEASGYLHIGHAKAALLNQYFARMYEGRLIVRFDDTNPSKERMEYEESIVEDLRLLDVKADTSSYTSDYFDQIYDYAIKLIQAGEAYCDDTALDVMRDERGKGVASKNRDLSVQENLELFALMKQATEKGQTYCLRAKMSVDNKNKAMRDPVMYRCNLLPHNRTGEKWKMYPTYDFACPIVDSLEGVTHALRTSEYRDRNDQYYWFIEKLGLRKPLIWDYSRVNFVYTLLSKRKLQALVDMGLVTGWDDPRFPTVRGIRRRGLTIEALKKYILMQGASKNTLLLEWDKLWALNKQVIDPIAPRYCALNSAGLVSVHLTDGPANMETKELAKHKKNPDLGMKVTSFYNKVYLDASDASALVANEEVTLMDWGNVIVDSVTKAADGTVNGVTAHLHLEGDFKKTKKKLTWLAALPDTLTPVETIEYDYLITKKKIEDGEKYEDYINPRTEYVSAGVGDANLRQVKCGDIIQLERRGYYICDRAWSLEKPCRLIFIPDGRVQTIALKQPVGPDSKPLVAN